MAQKQNKIQTKRIPITLTEEQLKLVSEKIGLLGTNQSDVLKYIVTNWLNENIKEKKNK